MHRSASGQHSCPPPWSTVAIWAMLLLTIILMTALCNAAPRC